MKRIFSLSALLLIASSTLVFTPAAQANASQKQQFACQAVAVQAAEQKLTEWFTKDNDMGEYQGVSESTTSFGDTHSIEVNYTFNDECTGSVIVKVKDLDSCEVESIKDNGSDCG